MVLTPEASENVTMHKPQIEMRVFSAMNGERKFVRCESHAIQRP